MYSIFSLNFHSQVEYSKETPKKSRKAFMFAGTGPTGVILTTMNTAFTIADNVCQDFKNQVLTPNPDKQGLDYSKFRTVYWQNWQKIDKYEEEEGKKLGKPREKIVEVEKMLKVAGV